MFGEQRDNVSLYKHSSMRKVYQKASSSFLKNEIVLLEEEAQWVVEANDLHWWYKTASMATEVQFALYRKQLTALCMDDILPARQCFEFEQECKLEGHAAITRLTFEMERQHFVASRPKMSTRRCSVWLDDKSSSTACGGGSTTHPGLGSMTASPCVMFHITPAMFWPPPTPPPSLSKTSHNHATHPAGGASTRGDPQEVPKVFWTAHKLPTGHCDICAPRQWRMTAQHFQGLPGHPRTTIGPLETGGTYVGLLGGPQQCRNTLEAEPPPPTMNGGARGVYTHACSLRACKEALVRVSSHIASNIYSSRNGPLQPLAPVCDPHITCTPAHISRPCDGVGGLVGWIPTHTDVAINICGDGYWPSRLHAATHNTYTAHKQAHTLRACNGIGGLLVKEFRCAGIGDTCHDPHG
ncbi:hypothetical protein K439DRAFT_1621738 [Ramaria rubella]|nr:hypothetical protein K439DRAFT_1621738 [Ramaria rubella]